MPRTAPRSAASARSFGREGCSACSSAPRLSRCLELLETRTLTDAVTAAADPSLRLLIDRHLATVSRTLGDALSEPDLEALGEAAEQTAATDWGDVLVTSSRTLFIARQAESRS